MSTDGFDVPGMLRAFTGLEWGEDAPDPISGIRRLSAEGDRRYVAEVARDGDHVGFSVSPARFDWSPISMPRDFRNGASMRGGRRRGLEWRAINCADGVHWRVGIDLAALGTDAPATLAACLPAAAR